MATTIVQIPGSQIVQQDQAYANLVFSDQEGVVYNPNPEVEGEQDAYFSHNIAPPVTDNFAWNQIKLNWTRSSDSTPEIFEALFTLEGVLLDGTIELLGEKIITSISGSEVTEDILFDLYSSRSTPSFRKVPGTANAGKIQLNLPMRWLQFEGMDFCRSWLDGWSKRKRITITNSSSTWYSGYTVRQIEVAYDGDMQSDFRDIRFTDQDGRTFLCYERESYTASTSATFNVLVPNLNNGEARTIYMYYGNSSVSGAGNPFNILEYYDNFEDGKYTGRSSPYRSFSARSGSLSIESVSPISGNYSLKHTGNGSAVYCSFYTPYTFSSYVVSFDFKLTNRGSATNTPYVNLWYIAYQDSDSWVRVDTYWSGSYQILRLVKNDNGTMTTYGQWNWSTSKLPLNTVYHVTIIDTMNTNCKVLIDGVQRINAAYSASLARDSMSFGCNRDSAGVWDNIRFSEFNPGITAGSFGSEEATITVSPDTPAEADTTIRYTTPADWTSPDMAYLASKQLGHDIYNTNLVKVTPLDVLEHGYNSVDRYQGMRLGMYLKADNNCNIRINNMSYAYEVI